ncbi:hypothetical protein [Mycolicibacterium mageritense]|uniref:hypothetical protein n=1 Tax=Mycolicibacterium mageritense TaxID=53462 RepID=UPI0011D9CBE2|nr:hypothetical protein [Mycolicibacterium mageritense]TXI54019.1 MAG: hypothetical protein E6Q55_33535 [Mycolicibacterium mageritense]
MRAVRTDAEAIAQMRAALRAYGEQVEPTAAAARREMAQALGEIAEYAKECSSNISRLQGQIDDLSEMISRQLSAPEPNDAAIQQAERRIAELRKQLAGWSRKLEETLRIQRDVVRAHVAFEPQQRRYTVAIDETVGRGSERMERARKDVVNFERRKSVGVQQTSGAWRPVKTGPGAPGHTAGPTSADLDSSGGSVYGDGASTSGGQGLNRATIAYDSAFPGAREGRFETPGEICLPNSTLVLVPIARCVDDQRVTSEADFVRISPGDARWAVTELYRQILPRMGNGGDLTSRLSASDAGAGRSGNRSLHATYTGFFHEEHRVKVTELADGGYDVANGAHRIWTARQLGMTHIPAAVRRING